MAFGRDAIVAKIQRYISMRVVVDSDLIALEQQSILVPRKIIAPQAFFTAHHEIGIVPALCPRERRRRVESNAFSSKSHLARFQDNRKDHITKRSREQSTKTSCEPRIGSHQGRDSQTANDARDCSADCYPVWNNEMLKIDECPYDEERNKNPVRDRHLPRKAFPDRQKKKGSNQFHGEVAERNLGATICAATAKHNPTDQRQILVPGNRPLAVRAERATRLVNRKIDRPAVNADV